MEIIDKNELRVRMEAVVQAFENYCETLDSEEYEIFYETVNDVLELCD